MAPEDTDTATDPRAVAALAVLAGEPADAVAERVGVPEALVVRWAQQFVAAGTAALRGDHGGDPAHRDRFLTLVSHELRTPLSVLQGWVETLRTAPAATRDPELLSAGLAAIASHTERLSRLARDLLDSAAVSVGRLRLEVTDLDLGEVAAEVAESFEGDRVSIDAPHVSVRADRDRVGQIVTNLVHDGLSRTSAQLRLSITADADWATIRLSVPTTPPPYDEMRVLFEPFDAGTGDAHTGLSLYVCRALAVAHGGQCGVDAGDQMEFWVRLPVAGPTDVAPD